MRAITWKDYDHNSSGFCAAFGSGSIASIDRWRDDLFEWNAPVPSYTADGQLYGGRQSRHSGIAKTLEDAKLFVAVEVAMWFFRARPTMAGLTSISPSVENHSKHVNKLVSGGSKRGLPIAGNSTRRPISPLKYFSNASTSAPLRD